MLSRTSLVSASSESSAHAAGGLLSVTHPVTRPAPVNVKDIGQAIASRLLDGLKQVGCFHRNRTRENQEETLQEVHFKDIKAMTLGPRAWVMMTVDMLRLPVGVTSDDLKAPSTLRHLSDVCQVPIELADLHGVVYVATLHEVDAGAPAIDRLPRKVALDLNARPSGAYMVPVGQTREGPLWISLANNGHTLIGGATTGGKTRLIKSWLSSLCLYHAPADLHIAIIDPKADLMEWNHAGQLLAPVATTGDAAEKVVKQVSAELERRLKLFADVGSITPGGASTLDTYNRVAIRQGRARLPLIILIVDEFISLLVQHKKQLFDDFIRLTSMGASRGIKLVMMTQNPKAEYMATEVRGNCSLRIAFACNEAAQSRTILDKPGAEQLPKDVPGRLLAVVPGKAEPVEAQAYLLDDAALARVVRSLPFAKATTQTATPDKATDVTAGAAVAAPAIDPLTKQLVTFADKTFNGAFPINEIYNTINEGIQESKRPREEHIQKHKIEKIGKQLESRGLLIRGDGANKPRMITPDLRVLCGLPARQAKP